jgi:hypothetical protein
MNRADAVIAVPARLACGAALAMALLWAPAKAAAQEAVADDAALADLIESLARRDEVGTIRLVQAEGIIELPLGGRLSQLAPARDDAGGKPVTTGTDAPSDAQITSGSSNTPPAFTAVIGLVVSEGSIDATPVVIGSVSDAQTPAGSLVVTQVAPGNVTARNITNTNGTIRASLSATCAPFAQVLRFEVSDGSLTGTGSVPVGVSTNVPPVIAYGMQGGVLGRTLTVPPSSGPSDNGAITSLTISSVGTFTGTASIVPATGVITLGNIGPVGTHTFTVRAVDNCGTSRDATFNLTVAPFNTQPGFTSAGNLQLQQGTVSTTPVILGTAVDNETPAGQLVVTRVPGGGATGITVTDITNTNGTIRGIVNASCTATTGQITLQVSDGLDPLLTSIGVGVTFNSSPDLTYAAASVNINASATLTPATGASDNGPNPTVTLLPVPKNFLGSISANPTTGVLSITNARPADNFRFFVARVTDNCGVGRDAFLDLTVVDTPPTFQSAGPISLRRDSPAGAPIVLGTVSDGQTPAGSLTFRYLPLASLGNVLLTDLTNTNGTITARVRALCSAVPGSLVFEVGDGILTSGATVGVSLIDDTPPSLSYPAGTVLFQRSNTIAPLQTPPGLGAFSTNLFFGGTYLGATTINQTTGAVTFSGAAPIGTHAVQIRTMNSCGVATFANILQLTVLPFTDDVFRDGFETPP